MFERISAGTVQINRGHAQHIIDNITQATETPKKLCASPPEEFAVATALGCFCTTTCSVNMHDMCS